MWRYLVGAGAGLVLVVAGMLLSRALADPVSASGAMPQTSTAATLAPQMAFGDLPEPPKATDLSREQKRFNRYDKDKNEKVDRAEYLAARTKAFAKLDRNGDGKLDFEEYAVKTVGKFTAADKDKSNSLNRAEFSTTRVIRKPAPRCNCSRASPAPAEAPLAAPAPPEADDEG